MLPDMKKRGFYRLDLMETEKIVKNIIVKKAWSTKELVKKSSYDWQKNRKINWRQVYLKKAFNAYERKRTSQIPMSTRQINNYVCQLKIDKKIK